jgi:hypothetical protein
VTGDALADPHVQVVEADRLDPDPNLAGGGIRRRTVVEAECLGASVLVNDHRAHDDSR